ncbi:Macrophage mannose receptor 1 [Merluccius polli]|uniref:Macrophage mannose receptor 1 n=1 Tax=Merluccius polli TaxID=89951 RepID=A0AA47NUS7_MERPO|nr:Macrophage mannose receptor 1 [Merluccius polli]
MSWSKAQNYCREFPAGDLATVGSPEDQEELVNATRGHSRLAWIGLYDKVGSWMWSLLGNGNSSGEDVEPWSWPWEDGEPDNWRGCEGCGLMHNGLWSDQNCNNKHPFLCFHSNTNDTILGDSSIIFVNIQMNWSDAQAYCRENYTDLPSIRNLEENNLVSKKNRAESGSWIGLYRNLWATWSDGSNSTFRHWRIRMPNNAAQIITNNCAVAALDNGLQWLDAPCHHSHRFICSTIPARKQLFRIKLSSAVIDPEVSEAILKQLHGKLKKREKEDFSLRWMKAPDGEIFNNIREDEKIKRWRRMPSNV